MCKKVLIFLLCSVLLASCATSQKIVYFQDTANGDSISLNDSGLIRFRPYDKLFIIVKSRDNQLSNLFNLATANQRLGSDANNNSSGGSSNLCGYTVDPEGNIDFPVLGTVKVGGLTRKEVETHIKDLLISNDLVGDPVVTCEYANLQVSILGEVANPGKYNITRDSYTILNAISEAGDLSITGKRGNVKVLRNENGTEKTYEMNLTSAKELMSSPAFYLQQNDVIYVTPNEMRSRQSTVNGNTVLSSSFWISIISLAASLFTTITVTARR